MFWLTGRHSKGLIPTGTTAAWADCVRSLQMPEDNTFQKLRLSLLCLVYVWREFDTE